MTERYKMSISRTTIDKLGIKLYDKVHAVVAELVANGYDADAEHVVVEAPLGDYLASRSAGMETDKGLEIRVKDDGHGMTPDEVNAYYLPVGKDRRIDADRGGASRVKNRAVMGRKGIGKLAPFGICKQIEVISSGGERTAEGFLTAHLTLKLDDILQETDAPYFPVPGKLDGTYQDESGTEIVLKDFRYRKIPEAEVFRRQLAGRFGLEQADWEILVRDSQTDAQFKIGELDVPLLEGTRTSVDERPVTLLDGQELAVQGWIGVSKDSYRDEIMAGIRIYARGKIVSQTRDFDIPAGFTGEHTLRSYLVGVIHADWLDYDEGEDLIRSDRQDILWNTEFGQAFQEWGRELIRELGRSSQGSRQQQSWQLFRDRSGIDQLAKERFDDLELRNGVLDVARIVARTSSRDSLEQDDYVQSVVDLAFSLGPHKVIVEKLHQASMDAANPFAALVSLFTQARIAEMYSLGQIANERVAAIENLETKIAEADDEAELQKLLEEAPWLIHPQWTVLTKNQSLERFRQAFERWYEEEHNEPVITSAIDYQNKRPDFVLLNFGNALQVVEIKKPGHQFSDPDFERLHKYYNAIESFLEASPEFREDFPNQFEITLVCDRVRLSPISRTAFAGLEAAKVLKKINWEEFLRRTKQMHEDFIAVSQAAGADNAAN